jgi:uncharacterized protein YijF (DUF1287 family)
MAIKQRSLLATFSLIMVSLLTASCTSTTTTTKQVTKKPIVTKPKPPVIVEHKAVIRTRAPVTKKHSFSHKLSRAALERTRHRVQYDGSYVKIGYPWGDVSPNRGVCTDVVIRSYRRLGIDLQQQVHQDMSRDFYAYPNLSKWKLTRPDPNIDHRRVYNMKVFLQRHGLTLPRTRNPNHYKPGDIVTWRLGPGQGHIGIVVDKRSKRDPRRHLVVHNIAEGPKLEDVLFAFPIDGHYRYFGKMKYIRASARSSFQASNNNTAQQSVAALLNSGNLPPELLK